MTQKMTLKGLREQFDPVLTQRQLAKMVGCSRQAISSWETGDRNPTRCDMMRLSQIFGYSYGEIEAMFGVKDGGISG